MSLLGDIASLIDRHARVGTPPPLPGVVLRRAEAPSTPSSGMHQAALALVVQGTKRTILADKVFDYGGGQYLVNTVELPALGYITEASPDNPFLAFVLPLRPEAIASLVIDTAVGEPAAQDFCGLSVSDATDDLLDPIARLLRTLDRPDDAAVLAPMIEREILWRLFNSEKGAIVRQIGLADSRLSRVARSLRWIREHYAETLRVDELADIARMSPPTFHRHFRAITAMSPIQYQKTIRLQEARARLMTGGRDAGTVSLDVGYESPSQFSRDYRRLFGAPPGQDMKRLRAG